MKAALALSLALFGCRGANDRQGGSLAVTEPSSGAAPSASPLASASAPLAPLASVAPPPQAPSALEREVDLAVRAAIERGDAPGAVVLVLHRGSTLLRRAWGQRAIEPSAEPMTPETVFDLASLTKPVATSTSVMLLVEDGKVRLGDSIGKHLRELAGTAAGAITVEQLLLHTSGLPADNDLSDYAGGQGPALAKIAALAPSPAPGAAFRYSDVGFVLLGALVERASGERLDRFFERRVARPLGLRDTGFAPAADLAVRAAPTEKRGGVMLRGRVHDPRAERLGGVAGHAGLFSTADDLGVFCRMLLGLGAIGGEGPGAARVMSEATARAWLSPRVVPGGKRALGWDVQTGYSSNRGELFPVGGVGHTGFTGTSVWVDRESETAVVVLTSRLHPSGKGNVMRLRREVATAAARAIAAGATATARAHEKAVEAMAQGNTAGPAGDAGDAGVMTGLEVIEREGPGSLAGKTVAVVTNQTGRDRDGRRTVDVLRAAEGVRVAAIFSPEHGAAGKGEGAQGDGRDAATGLPVHSLYGERRRPSASQLEGLDALVFDLQDAGCRFYTYETTLGYLLEAAAERHIRLVVLDRPNPLGGERVEGPVLEPGRESFTGYHAVPVRHGLTVGELARLFNAERKIGADLEVVPMRGWRRPMLFDETRLPWVDPSPNLKSARAALLYPGVGLLELTNLSVGRGTDRPFERVGAPWIDGEALARDLSSLRLAGVTFRPARFTPQASAFAGEACSGVEITVVDRERVEPVKIGLSIALALRKAYPSAWKRGSLGVLLASEATRRAVERGEGLEEIERLWAPALDRFRDERAKYLLYLICPGEQARPGRAKGPGGAKAVIRPRPGRTASTADEARRGPRQARPRPLPP